jgi:PAS domain S-box-containing protein
MPVDQMSKLIATRLFEANVVGIFTWTLDGAITGANQAFLRMVQYDREELASGRVRWTDLTPEEWYDRDERAIAELKASGVFQPYEKAYFRKDGSRVPILVGGALSEDSENEGVAFILDLSEQKRVEQKIREQEVKLQQILDFTPLCTAVLGPREEPIYANRALLDFFGLRLEEWQSQDAQTWFHPGDLEQIRWGPDGGPPDQYEARILRHDGKYRWFLVRNNALRDEKGQVMCWFVSGTDIEDRKQAEQLHADLTHASRVSTMGEMVASIAHELAQPITITTAHAQASLRWLQRDPPDVAEARKGTEKIIEAGALALEIINRLRSLYKKASLELELLAINQVIGEIAGMMRDEARVHGISIRTDLKDDLPKTVADRVQLQQVLMNLMLNGIEAMKDTGGVLTVKSQLGEDGQIEISVNDTGPGLPVGMADQIFDAFFTTKPEGSGMGLAICKSIVESQGGRIWVNNDGGSGATFHFTLPAVRAETNRRANVS